MYLAFLDEYLHRTLGLPSLPDYNAPFFELTFYRLIFPLIVQTVLVVVPALWGLRQGAGVVKDQATVPRSRMCGCRRNTRHHVDPNTRT